MGLACEGEARRGGRAVMAARASSTEVVLVLAGVTVVRLPGWVVVRWVCCAAGDLKREVRCWEVGVLEERSRMELSEASSVPWDVESRCCWLGGGSGARAAACCGFRGVVEKCR